MNRGFYHLLGEPGGGREVLLLGEGVREFLEVSFEEVEGKCVFVENG